MSLPGRYFAFSMASMMQARASSLEPRFGANPPSSPTPVLRPSAFSTARRLWNTSLAIRRASLKLGAPAGTIMNSWMSTLLSACWPPFRMLAMGTGMSLAETPPRYR
ncbi:MAG: hypothetical protein A4E73_01317 [Syntrophaceae bacterium PtaU1.Bin231]|nr:MAG: hypothetical protein A4E73_01317 [Syntrophaceae bacterium PtaU1.Bin231]